MVSKRAFAELSPEEKAAIHERQCAKKRAKKGKAAAAGAAAVHAEPARAGDAEAETEGAKYPTSITQEEYFAATKGAFPPFPAEEEMAERIVGLVVSGRLKDFSYYPMKGPPEAVWSSRLFARLAYEGFFVITHDLGAEQGGESQIIPLPELQPYYSAICWPWFHAAKHVKKTRRRLAQCGGYRLCNNAAPDATWAALDAYQIERHGSNWLTWKYFDTIKKASADPSVNFAMNAIGLYDGDELVAGEIGFTVGRIYTSLSGFIARPEAGHAQLVALGLWLERRGYAFWSMGHCYSPALDYKRHMGHRVYPRTAFLEKLARHRGEFAAPAAPIKGFAPLQDGEAADLASLLSRREASVLRGSLPHSAHPVDAASSRRSHSAGHGHPCVTLAPAAMRRSVVACSIGVGYAGELVESREWLWPLPLVRAPAAATSAPGGQPKPMRYRRRFDKKKAQESDKQLARELWATITGEGRAATGPHETRQPSSVDVKSLLRGLRQDVHRLRAMVEEAVAFLSREGVSEQAHWTTYSVALDVFAEAAHRAGALMCRDMMMAAGVRVLPSLWAKIIRSTVKEPRLAHQYLNDMLEYGVTPDVAVYNALLYVVVRCPAKKHNSGPSSAAAAVADDAVAAEAFRIYYEMLATGVYITYDTYRIMFQAVATMAQFKLLECFMRHSPPIHDQDRRRQGMRHGRPRGLSPIPMAMTAMRLARSVEEAVGCLNAVRNEKPFQLSGATRITVYTGLINACVRLGDWKAFVAATHEAQKLHGEAGDALFFQAILMGCATFTQKALKATPPASTGLYDTLAAATYQAALRTSAARTRQLFRAMAHYYMYTGDRRRAREVYRQQDREYQIRVSAGQTADLRELEQECAAMARVRRRAAAAAPVWDGLPALNTQEKADRLALKNDPAPLVPVEGVSAF